MAELSYSLSSINATLSLFLFPSQHSNHSHSTMTMKPLATPNADQSKSPYTDNKIQNPCHLTHPKYPIIILVNWPYSKATLQLGRHRRWHGFTVSGRGAGHWLREKWKDSKEGIWQKYQRRRWHLNLCPISKWFGTIC